MASAPFLCCFALMLLLSCPFSVPFSLPFSPSDLTSDPCPPHPQNQIASFVQTIITLRHWKSSEHHLPDMISTKLHACIQRYAVHMNLQQLVTVLQALLSMGYSWDIHSIQPLPEATRRELLYAVMDKEAKLSLPQFLECLVSWKGMEFADLPPFLVHFITREIDRLTPQMQATHIRALLRALKLMNSTWADMPVPLHTALVRMCMKPATFSQLSILHIFKAFHAFKKSVPTNLMEKLLTEIARHRVGLSLGELLQYLPDKWNELPLGVQETILLHCNDASTFPVLFPSEIVHTLKGLGKLGAVWRHLPTQALEGIIVRDAVSWPPGSGLIVLQALHAMEASWNDLSLDTLRVLVDKLVAEPLQVKSLSAVMYFLAIMTFDCNYASHDERIQLLWRMHDAMLQQYAALSAEDKELCSRHYNPRCFFYFTMLQVLAGKDLTKITEPLPPTAGKPYAPSEQIIAAAISALAGKQQELAARLQFNPEFSLFQGGIRVNAAVELDGKLFALVMFHPSMPILRRFLFKKALYAAVLPDVPMYLYSTDPKVRTLTEVGQHMAEDLIKQYRRKMGEGSGVEATEKSVQRGRRRKGDKRAE